MKVALPGGTRQLGALLARALLEHGFTFQFPTWQEASGDLCQRWRDQRLNIK